MKPQWFKNTPYGLWPNDAHGWTLSMACILIAMVTFFSFYANTVSLGAAVALFSPYLIVDSAVLLTVAYATSAKTHWFVTKTYGWGWTPSTWQGWYILLLYLMVLTEILYLSRVLTSIDPIVASYITVDGTLAISALVFLILYATGERPRWRWGK